MRKGNLRYFLLNSLLGAIAIEAVAAALQLWEYTPPWVMWLNVAVTWLAVIAGGAYLLQGRPLYAPYLLGAAWGFALEEANFAWLHLWTFPNDRLFGLRGRHAISAGLALAWGLAPLANILLVKHAWKKL